MIVALPQALQPIQIAWDEAAAAPLRACQLCQHERTWGVEQRCAHPAGANRPVRVVRSRDDACGPNAVLMDPTW